MIAGGEPTDLAIALWLETRGEKDARVVCGHWLRCRLRIVGEEIATWRREEAEKAARKR